MNKDQRELIEIVRKQRDSHRRACQMRMQDGHDLSAESDRVAGNALNRAMVLMKGHCFKPNKQPLTSQ